MVEQAAVPKTPSDCTTTRRRIENTRSDNLKPDNLKFDT
jgi:hypothetical protein